MAQVQSAEQVKSLDKVAGDGAAVDHSQSKTEVASTVTTKSEIGEPPVKDSSCPKPTNNGISSQSSDGANWRDCSSPKSPNGNLANNAKEKTAMCLINELARFNKLQHQYRLTNETGPGHKKTFTVTLLLGQEEYEAKGPSIKKAQHAAATMALQESGYIRPPAKPKRKEMKSSGVTPTVELNALAMKRGELAEYRCTRAARSPPPYMANYNYRGMFHHRYPPMMRFHQPCSVALHVGKHEFIGEGQTLQAARHHAAATALKVLRELPFPEGGEKPDVPTETNAQDEFDANSDLKSPISLVHEISLKRDLRVEFEVVRESGPPHMRTFVTKCIVGNLETEGEGNGKKISKKRAAEKMLEELKKLSPLPSAAVQRVKKKPSPVKKKSRNLIKVQKGNPEYGQGINPISRLIQIQQAKREKEPVYSLVAERGLPRMREFIIEVTVGPHSCTGTGPNKKFAKRSAAEGLLQMLGYVRPPNQIAKPSENEGNRKTAFVEQDAAVGERLDNSETRCAHGRQLVPGLLLMPDAMLNSESNATPYNYSSHVPAAEGLHWTQGGQDSLQESTSSKVSMHTAAVIAKELLEFGSSPTAETMLHANKKPVPVQQALRPKQQLVFLADVLGLNIQFTDFPRGNKREYLSLVTLFTNPSQVSHGAGETVEASHDQAALTALHVLAELNTEPPPASKAKKEPSVISNERRNYYSPWMRSKSRYK